MRATIGLSLAVVLAGAVSMACRPHEQHEETTSAPAASDAHEHAPEPGDFVRVAPEMLRDLRITTAPTQARAGGEGVTVLGDVKVNEDAYAEIGLGAAARVVRALVSPGERVRAGEPLAELESTELANVRAVVASAAARAALSRRALARKRELVDERIVARRELYEAEAEAEAAAAELRAARAALSAFGASSDDLGGGARLTLLSPIDGNVLERSITAGQMTEPGRALFRIGDIAKLWLVVHVFERDAVRVHVGANARINFSALPGQTAPGTVTLVGSQVDASSRTVPIRIEVANPDGMLRPGMSATAWLPLGEAGDVAVAVPAAAMQRTQKGWCVFLPRGEGRFEKREVGRGRDLGGEVEVLSGLEAGEVVVVDGAFLLKAESEKARGGGERHDH